MGISQVCKLLMSYNLLSFQGEKGKKQSFIRYHGDILTCGCHTLFQEKIVFVLAYNNSL